MFNFKPPVVVVLEQRLCELGSSWSGGSCSSEMARWTVLWRKIPGIQHLIHVPGSTHSHTHDRGCVSWRQTCVFHISRSNWEGNKLVELPQHQNYWDTTNSRSRVYLWRGGERKRKTHLRLSEMLKSGWPKSRRWKMARGWKENYVCRKLKLFNILKADV